MTSKSTPSAGTDLLVVHLVLQRLAHDEAEHLNRLRLPEPVAPSFCFFTFHFFFSFKAGRTTAKQNKKLRHRGPSSEGKRHGQDGSGRGAGEGGRGREKGKGYGRGGEG